MKHAVRRAASACLVLWLGLGASSAGEPVDSVVGASPLSVVLGVLRAPDQDVLFLRDGSRLAGRLAQEHLDLHTVHGELRLPVSAVAALDLADDRAGLSVVITDWGDRFTGFLAGTHFHFQAAGDTPPREVRHATLLKAVRRLTPSVGEPSDPRVRVRLRNGDFFTGQLLTDRFRVQTTGAEVRWAAGTIGRVTFPHSGQPGARLEWVRGETVSAQPVEEDLEFRLGWRASWRVYAGRVDAMVAGEGAALPADWVAQIGGSPDSGTGANSAAGGPDPAVVARAGMVWIPPGIFTMGSPPDERERDLDEGPLTQVVLPEGFWIGQHEVTQAEYLALMGTNPSHHEGQALHPVEKVSWQDAADYGRRLTALERQAGNLPEGYAYRLPTEAEWEYACRGGTTTRFNFGDDADAALIRDHAWFSRNAESATHPVGTRKPNAWGLFDVHGNVLEWCLDGWRSRLPGGQVTNVAVAPTGTLRAVRGGSWLYEARHARSANRDSYGVLVRCSDLGFRVVLARDVEPSGVSPGY
ncbi:MAG: formylglycine-generating enzyme family protein [Verrucomicrobiales bacterium]|nr:formylglycine-generating enzyme family protein [Verrucomicrobiales bacterium]